MGSFGQNLRRQRELRGITLDEIAQHTRISSRMFEAIERDRFDLLPGGVFNRSFVLHYARFLGLDEEQVGADFDLAVGAPRPPELKEIVAQRERHAASAAVRPALAAGSRRVRVVLASLLLAISVGLAVYQTRETWWPLASAAAAGFSEREQGDVTPPPRLTGPGSGNDSPGPSVPVLSASRDASSTPAPAPDRVLTDAEKARLRLQVDTVESSWVAAYADGQKKWQSEMRAGETRVLTADASIELRVGNAAAVVLTLNGETQPPLGRKGETRTVTFGAQDLRRP